MKKELIIKGLKFQFRNTSDNKDGYFEYIDVKNPTGVRRLPFSLDIEKSEFRFHELKFVDGESEIALDEFVEIVKEASGASIVEGALITGLRFYYRHAKKLRACSLRIYVDRHDGIQYHFVADRASFSKYIDKEGQVHVPGRTQQTQSEKPAQAQKKPQKKQQAKVSRPADPSKLNELVENFGKGKPVVPAKAPAQAVTA